MTYELNSPEYNAAIEASNAAIKTFFAVRDAYRARTVGDAEFLAAKAAYEASRKAFDAAYDAEKINARRRNVDAYIARRASRNVQIGFSF